jgi:uncharacterized repeat protein (TIGR02543 family)
MELGMKFRADVDGFVTALRYYKPAGATGTHTGHLWSGAGAQLAQQVFTGETPSGWQEIALTTPVAITANTTYVVSYFSSSGDYTSTPNYFTQPTGGALVHGLADGTDGPNGLFLYTAAPAFPTQAYNSSNYWADVVFATSTGPDVTPPAVTDHVPAASATAVPIGTTVTVTFSEQLDPLTVDGSTFQLQDAQSVPVPASVSYDGGSFTATLTPSAALDPLASYTAIVRGGATDPRIKDTAGNALVDDETWSFTTAGRPPQSFTVFPASEAPTDPVGNDQTPFEGGMKWRSTVDGTVTALRYYKPVGATGTHTGSLWTGAGTLLAQQVFTGETASGWQEVTLTTPVPITAGQTYVVSYFSASGDYVGTNFYFTQQVGTGLVHGLANGTDGPNGVYLYTASPAFPTQTFQSSNYWADVRFVPDVADVTAPTVTGRVPLPDATDVVTNTTIEVTWSEVLDASTVDGSTFELRDAFDVPVPASVAYTTGTFAATLVPSAWLDPLTTYTVIVRGGASDPRVKDPSGNALAADVVWSFTTGAVPMGPFTVFPANEAPSNPVFNDNQPTVSMELGMKFRADVPGFVTALRYYKPVGATGTHTGHLWTGTGTLLATQEFTGETASGWQEVALTNPVPITAGTTYLVSYFSASGDYAATANYFTQPIGTGVLHGLANGTDGPNGLYEYTAAPTFPTQTFNSANYWADVVFDTASHSLTVTVAGSGSVAKNPDQGSYYPGSQVELTATPDAGYSFSGWSGDATGAANPLTVMMDADKAITATFTQIPILRVLTLHTAGNGSVTKDPDLANYVDGSSVQLTAVADPHHSFAGWSGDAGGTSNPLTVRMDADKTITATFTLDTHTVATGTVGGGSVTRNPDLPAYDYGSSVELTATADVGHTFAGWSGDASGTTNPLTVLVDGDKTITATFTLDTHTLTLQIVGGGTVDRSPDLPAYPYGSSVVLTPTRDGGQVFAGWSGDASGAANPLTVLMDGDKDITATFTSNGQLPASNTASGRGCYTLSNSFYQYFPTASAAAALSGNSLTLTPSGSAYDVTWGGGSYVAPGMFAATILAGIDDGQVTIVPSAAVPHPGGSAASLSVHSNGIIGTGAILMPDTPDSHTPTVAGLLDEATSAWFVWHDFHLPEGGAIRWEELGGVLYVTWLDVESYPDAPTANPSTFQFQFDLNPGPTYGVVRYVWQSITAVGTGQTTGRAEQTLVGWSPGGASLDAGSVDLATATPLSTWAIEVPALQLAIAPAPISTGGGGTLVTYTVHNVPEAAPASGVYIGAVFLGFTPIPGGLDLGMLLGAPGCNAYIATTDIPVNVGPFSADVQTGDFLFGAGIPYGVSVTAQAIALVVPGSLPNGQNPGGVVTSNAVDQFVSDY